MTLRLLILIPSLEAGGAERQAVALAVGLSRRHEVHVVTFYPGGAFVSDLTEARVALHCIDKAGRWDVTALLRFLALVRRLKPQVVYSWLPHTNVYSSCLLLVPRRPRLAWSIRDAGAMTSELSQFARLILAAEPRLASRVDAVIANSEAGRIRAIERGFPSSTLHVASNGIDTLAFGPGGTSRDHLRLAWGLESSFAIGVVARLDPVKDHRTFLRAAALAGTARADLRFVIVGGGSEAYKRELEYLAASLGIAERVVFAGPRRDVAEVLSAFDLATLTSVVEGFPNALGEAMATGLPCVATDVGDCARLLGNCGLIVPPGDPRALAAAWLDLASRPAADRTAMSRAATRRIAEDFSVETMTSETERILEHLLST